MANQKKQSSEAAIREIRRRTRRKFSPEEKIRIVLEGLRGEQNISDLCRRESIASNLPVCAAVCSDLGKSWPNLDDPAIRSTVELGICFRRRPE